MGDSADSACALWFPPRFPVDDRTIAIEMGAVSRTPLALKRKRSVVTAEDQAVGDGGPCGSAFAPSAAPGNARRSCGQDSNRRRGTATRPAPGRGAARPCGAPARCRRGGPHQPQPPANPPERLLGREGDAALPRQGGGARGARIAVPAAAGEVARATGALDQEPLDGEGAAHPPRRADAQPEPGGAGTKGRLLAGVAQVFHDDDLQGLGDGAKLRAFVPKPAGHGGDGSRRCRPEITLRGGDSPLAWPC